MVEWNALVMHRLKALVGSNPIFSSNLLNFDLYTNYLYNTNIMKKKLSRSESGKLGAIATAITMKIRRENEIIEYNKNPKKCLECSEILDFYSKQNKFCSRLCAALINGRKKTKAKFCLNCNKPTRLTYCNHICQQDYRWKTIHVPQILSGVAGSRKVKKYLLQTRGHKCQHCKNCTWLNKPITLEIEHIDGNHMNNKLDNVELLCPNCHSMTPTYKSKNNGNGRHVRRQRYQQGKSH